MTNSQPVTFGTAGLRAPVGSGPDKINVSTVTRATAGVADWLLQQAPTGDNQQSENAPLSVAVACDSRYGSPAFAAATAEVFAARGFSVTMLSGNTPTPVLAWVVKDRELDAGVQITASHNPKADNGYKLYLSGGSQLTSPADREIEALIVTQPPAEEIPRSTAISVDSGAAYGYQLAASGIVASSESTVLSARRKLRIAYTPMHGVGGDVVESVLRANGFSDIHAVPSQRWPDPEFPTVEFPNPEEPGATDQLLALAEQVNADLLFALDPDADRCMIGVPTGSAAGAPYRMLSGNEAGPLLARRIVGDVEDGQEPPVVATTIVSSQLLGVMASQFGWDYVETHTGFKNLARAADDRPGELVFAYEEAIGICPAPHVVADKDGITTTLVTATWAAELALEGKSLLDELYAIESYCGIFRSAQVSIRRDSVAEAGGVIKKFVAQPPTELAGITVTAEPLDADPAAGVRLTGRAQGRSSDLHVRVVARPSGTEAKAKFYLEVHGGAGDQELVEKTLADLEVDIPRAVESVSGIA